MLRILPLQPDKSVWEFSTHAEMERILNIVPLPLGPENTKAFTGSMDLDQKISMFEKKRKRISDSPVVKKTKITLF